MVKSNWSISSFTFSSLTSTVTVVLSTALLAVGCKGSNPNKNYTFTNDTRAYDPSKKVQRPIDPNKPLDFCRIPFTIEVRFSGQKTLPFPEDTETSYEISVRPYFKISAQESFEVNAT